ncbi:MAG: hypothetical protein CO093_05035 [Alphaproteobacteria bacterium CG_4_9_14_3_um_filter_47_13]|nr:MAG: hypothetical protein CO093_05035 [Alphaproteobacteria bacterium CG_4_9_14_3_um_filter_47_13]
MWLAIWFVFTVFIVVFVGWTLFVLFQQKKAWAAFAKKHKMKYQSPRLMESPIVTGQFGAYQLSLYTGTQQTDDVRGQRFITVIEFQFGAGMATGAAISTKEFTGFISGLAFNHIIKPDLAEWKDEYVVKTRDEKNLKSYFTKERQQALVNIFTMKHAAVLFFFDEIETVLRVETSDPLRNAVHLDKIVKRLKETSDILALNTEEKKQRKKLLAAEKERLEYGEDGVPDEQEETEKED